MSITTANDNVPLGDNVPSGYNNPRDTHFGRSASAPLELLPAGSKESPVSAVSVMSTRIESASAPTNPVLTSSTGKKTKRKKTGGRFPVYLLLLLWLILAATIARFAGGQNNNLISGENLVSVGSSFGLLSLWLASLARRRQSKVAHSIGIAGVCASVAGFGWLYFNQLASTALVPEFLVMGFAAINLVFAKLWRTPFLLHLSLCLMIGWTSYVFINTQISQFVWLFPALWSLQMLLAMNFRIKRTIALSMFTGLLWIGVNLSLLA